jgi:hypothetical protein
MPLLARVRPGQNAEGPPPGSAEAPCNAPRFRSADSAHPPGRRAEPRAGAALGRDALGAACGVDLGADLGAACGVERGAARGADLGAACGVERGAARDSDLGAACGVERGAARGADLGAA